LAVFRTYFECTLNEQVLYMTFSQGTVEKQSTFDMTSGLFQKKLTTFLP